MANTGHTLPRKMETYAWLEPFAATGRSHNAYLSSPKKRALDIIVASVLLLLLVPLFAFLMAIIRLNSPGPSLFRQQRHGSNRRPFHIFKFRSMYYQANLGPEIVQAKRGDKRVTAVGKIMRKTSIDELPQLVNVLRGEMSLVGPRPHALSHDEHFSQVIAKYDDRFIAKPGITGLAQVNGARGETPAVMDMKRRIDLDVEYVHKASFTLDCWILTQTVREIFASKSAF